MGKVSLYGLISLSMKVTFIKMRCKVSVSKNGQMEDVILVNGIKVACMVKASSLLQMGVVTKDNTQPTLNKATEFLNGPTVKNTREIG